MIIEAAKVDLFTLAWSGKVSDRLVMMMEAAKIASFTLAWSGHVASWLVIMMEAANVASFTALNSSVMRPEEYYKVQLATKPVLRKLISTPWCAHCRFATNVKPHI